MKIEGTIRERLQHWINAAGAPIYTDALAEINRLRGYMNKYEKTKEKLAWAGLVVLCLVVSVLATVLVMV